MAALLPRSHNGSMSEHVQVTTSAASREEAERIATALVEERLAACVHVLGPVASVYRWKGRVERTEEWRCIAKTTRDRFGDVEALIRKVHSYELPEVIATPIVAGSAAYLAWLQEETSDAAESQFPPREEDN